MPERMTEQEELEERARRLYEAGGVIDREWQRLAPAMKRQWLEKAREQIAAAAQELATRTTKGRPNCRYCTDEQPCAKHDWTIKK